MSMTPVYKRPVAHEADSFGLSRSVPCFWAAQVCACFYFRGRCPGRTKFLRLRGFPEVRGGLALGRFLPPSVGSGNPGIFSTALRSDQGLTGIMNGLVSSLPSMLTNAVPMLLMLGLGGLLLPLLGVSLFFREGQKRTFSLPSINPAILDGLADVLDRVTKAIEQGEKKTLPNVSDCTVSAPGQHPRRD
ncbi:hypothetical protein IscW_ISCW005232 [Ixodes scapularis]|uniref:Uncharacterized protein n=1 Tax=Ixodes scapularis TaxID=6945 RepID=B7PEW6_IXOSC|nr:hypothetical protein IscW_ISCW005232 [Ixodes scapularis]|eukprot:XP_002433738.1 hypothetical protein IscW_ISCW005232 [Ixodes scapularis]